jgi:hypothetical protein
MAIGDNQIPGVNFVANNNGWQIQGIGVPWNGQQQGLGYDYNDFTINVTCVDHRLTEFTVWEDIITANCSICNDRITFNAFPGGALSLRTRYLLEQYIMEGREASPDTLEKLIKLKELLELEIEELDVVRDRIDIIQKGIMDELNP